MRNWVLPLVAAGLALSLSACQAAPTPTPSQPGASDRGTQSPSAFATLTSPPPPSAVPLTPPQSVVDRLPRFGQAFQALAPEQGTLVRITPEAAVQTVLAAGPGWNWGNTDFEFRSVGCVFVVWVTERPMSYAPSPGPPYAAYLVQLLGDERGVPGAEMLVVVNATTGDLGSAYGPSVLGTTCGADRSVAPSASGM
jgi:hypothetical protein